MGSSTRNARIAGLLYLIIIVAGTFAEFGVRSTLHVSGDAAATANNIMASESLFRIGFVSDLVMIASDVALALLLYVLLKPVSAPLALLAAFFRLIQAAILGLNLLNHFAALLLVSGAGYMTVFEAAQVDALVLLFLEAHSSGYLISQVFFGLHCAILGLLLIKSRYLPSVLGALLIVAAMGYLAESLTIFLVPGLATFIGIPILLGLAGIAELSLCLWLLLKGASVPRPRQLPGEVYEYGR